MKILYFADNYTFDNYGTKRSIFEEMRSRGHEMIWCDKADINKIRHFIWAMEADQVWLAHSGLTIDPRDKEKIKIPIVGFGFSDPYYFDEARLDSYDVYVTNHRETFEKYKGIKPTLYNPTACDFRFHKPAATQGKNITVIGVGEHPRFADRLMRHKYVDMLRADGFRIHVYGKKWPKHPDNHPYVTGDEFLSVIQDSIIGIDIQDSFSPLAHRMFEYAGCGVPVITRERPEVYDVFHPCEIITYSDYHDLLVKLQFHTFNPSIAMKISSATLKRCIQEHNISHRIDKLLEGLKIG